MIAEHAAAVLALLDPDPVWTVYASGQVPAGIDPKATPYWVVWFTRARPEINFAGVSDAFQARIDLHSVAGNADAAQIGSDRAEALLLDVTPTVTGRVCHKIRWEESLPPQRDESTGVLVMDAIDRYVLLSRPG
jgi:hypothetical protein